MAIIPGRVNSIAKNGSTKLQGDVTLSQGTNITLTQTGQDISIASTSSGGITTVGNVTSGTVAFDGTVGTTLTGTAAGGLILLAASNSGGTGSAVSLTGGATTNAGSTGGNATLQGGTGNGAGAGGEAKLTGGIGGTTGAGGVVRLTGGSGGSTSGNAGDIFIGGGGATNGEGGSITLAASHAGGTNQHAGGIGLAGGNSTGTGIPGSVTVVGGNAESGSNTSGGIAQLTAGNGQGTGSGGTVTVQGGQAGLSGTGGSVNIAAKNGGATTGTGGSITLTRGSAAGGNNTGGNLSTVGGTGFGSGAGGDLTLSSGTGGATGAGGPVTISSGAAGATGPAAGGGVALNVGASKGTNQSGTSLNLRGGQGTGTGVGGSIAFAIAPAGASGSSNNALSTAMTIQGSGELEIGGTGLGANKLGILASDNSTAVVIKFNATQANVTAADTFIDFRSTTGSEGSIAGTAVAGVIAYNTFTGSHYTIVTGDRTNLVYGTLLEIVAGDIDANTWTPNPAYTYMETVYSCPHIPLPEEPVCTEKLTMDAMILHLKNDHLTEVEVDQISQWKEEKIAITQQSVGSPKTQLFKTRVCFTQSSKAAIGVWGGIDKEGRDMCLSIGTGHIFVANKGTNIEIGDYLISSNISGCAELQPDDIYRNTTIAEATENVVWNQGETSRLIGCIYLGG